MSPISKIDAAGRQINCAIRLFFNDDDDLAIHTLAHAGFRILYDLYPKHKGDDFVESMKIDIETMGWGRFNKVPNFLKHADRDWEDILCSHSAAETQVKIGFGCILYDRICGVKSIEMRAFDDWAHMRYPRHFKIPTEEDADFEAIFQLSSEFIDKMPWKIQILMGKILLETYQKNPTILTSGLTKLP